VSNDFRVTAKALIFFDDRILLIRKPEGVWDLPGGRLEIGEDPEEALRREIREELGIKAEVTELADCTVRRVSKGPKDVFVVSYHCKTKASLKDIELSEEHTEAALFPISKVPTLPMHDAYKTAVRRGAEKRRRNAAAKLHPTASEAIQFLFNSRVLKAA
jgi:ADP-ribose pyrophosphatase YjhB (NUDIX family)